MGRLLLKCLHAVLENFLDESIPSALLRSKTLAPLEECQRMAVVASLQVQIENGISHLNFDVRQFFLKHVLRVVDRLIVAHTAPHSLRCLFLRPDLLFVTS